MIHITAHACQRYIERINPGLTLAQAHDAIEASTRVCEIAAGFGCGTIRLGNGGKLVLDGKTVVTCLAPRWTSKACMTPIGAVL